jgi:predicted TPR repeat methyltransferase
VIPLDDPPFDSRPQSVDACIVSHVQARSTSHITPALRVSPHRTTRAPNITTMATVVETPVTRLNAEDLFDSVGPSYEDAFATCTEQQASVDWLIQQLPSHATILDIGCGTGRPVCSSLAAAGHSAIGIDISTAMIDAARRNVPTAKFEKADIKTFTPNEGIKYDAVTVYFSLIASVTQQEIKDVFARVYTWLKPGGIFVFATVPISGESLDISWMGRPITVSSLSQEEALEALKAIGFEVVKTDTSKFLPQAAKAGICDEKDVWEEDHLFVYSKK